MNRLIRRALPSREYFRWLDETENIIKHMNDGFVSHEDLSERNEFLEMSYQRETELMVCISLYQNSVFKGAKDKANELTYKLTKLRQMRSMIKQTTKDQADRKVEKSEYEKALEYYRAVRQLKEHDLYWNLPEPVLENMGRAAYEAGLQPTDMPTTATAFLMPETAICSQITFGMTGCGKKWSSR